MTLLLTVFAAISATIIWYFNENRSKYRLGFLALMFWGASLMWLMDFVFEYAELKAGYFDQEFADILNDSLLGVSVIALGLIVWLIALLVRDPKAVIRKKAR